MTTTKESQSEKAPEPTLEPTPEPTPQNVQNVQNEKGKPYIQIAQDEAGKWHWVLWSGNGRGMATNTRPYGSQADCNKAVHILFEMLRSGKVPVLIQHHEE